MSYVTIDALRKRYGGDVEALKGIDLSFEKGEFVVIVGPSGCGKSTLLRMIAGLEGITSGEIGLDGQIVNDLDPADRGCAMVFQNYALYPHMTVAKNIAYPLKLAKVAQAERDARVREAARILGLEPYLNRLPKALSGGQRQRVAMGRAIVRDPKLFLFDEPLSNLDAKLRVQMRIELRRLHRKLGATSILVTHDQVEAMTMADRLVVMNGGEVEQVGSPEEVYARPASAFVAGFLGAPAMNLLPAQTDAAGRPRLDAAPETPLSQTAMDEAGHAFLLGVRPEDLTVGPAGTGAVPAVIDLIEDLGGHRIAHCHVGDTSLAAILPRHVAFSEGDRIGLGAEGTALHAFDLASGKRLGTRQAGRLPSLQSA
jgi:sn-glycerol 3-phosphate transport system ATP-binding protein